MRTLRFVWLALVVLGMFTSASTRNWVAVLAGLNCVLAIAQLLMPAPSAGSGGEVR